MNEWYNVSCRLSVVSANSIWKCNRTLFVSSPQRGEMFIARRSFLYSEAPKERNRFAYPLEGSADEFRS
jgi:hypothetical protein